MKDERALLQAQQEKPLRPCESQWDGNCDRSAFQGPNGLFSRFNRKAEEKLRDVQGKLDASTQALVAATKAEAAQEEAAARATASPGRAQTSGSRAAAPQVMEAYLREDFCSGPFSTSKMSALKLYNGQRAAVKVGSG